MTTEQNNQVNGDKILFYFFKSNCYFFVQTAKQIFASCHSNKFDHRTGCVHKQPMFQLCGFFMSVHLSFMKQINKVPGLARLFCCSWNIFNLQGRVLVSVGKLTSNRVSVNFVCNQAALKSASCSVWWHI